MTSHYERHESTPDDRLRHATLQVAAEIGSANTTIFDLEDEIIEKLDFGYDLHDLIKYLDELAPGSARRVNNLAQQVADDEYNSPQQTADRQDDLRQAFIAGYNSHKPD